MNTSHMKAAELSEKAAYHRAMRTGLQIAAVLLMVCAAVSLVMVIGLLTSIEENAVTHLALKDQA